MSIPTNGTWQKEMTVGDNSFNSKASKVWETDVNQLDGVTQEVGVALKFANDEVNNENRECSTESIEDGKRIDDIFLNRGNGTL